MTFLRGQKAAGRGRRRRARRRGRRAYDWLGALLMLVGLGRSSPGHAQATATWLEVEASADPCITAELLTAEVNGLLGPPPPGVRAQARALGRGWRIDLWHATGEHAVRRLPELPPACEDRRRAVSLAIVLAVEHALAATVTPPSQAEPLASPPPRPAPAAWGWLLEGQAGGSGGDLPQASPLLGAGLRAERGRWVPVELRLAVGPWQSEVSLAGGRVGTRPLWASLGGCRGRSVGARGRGRVDGCLGLELGAVWGRGSGFSDGDRRAAGHGAAQMGLAARFVPDGKLALTVRVEGFARFWKPEFQSRGPEGQLEGSRPLPPAGARLWLGLGRVFP